MKTCEVCGEKARYGHQDIVLVEKAGEESDVWLCAGEMRFFCKAHRREPLSLEAGKCK